MAAIHAPRIAIEAVQPSLDHGRFAAKASVDEPVTVSAVIFADGHDVLAAAVCWHDDLGQQQRVPMQLVKPLGRDLWEARFTPRRIGRHGFIIEAWWDLYGTYRHELAKKHQAGVPVELELEEGRRLVVAAAERSEGELKAALEARLDRFASLDGDDTRVALLLDEETLQLMQAADERPHLTRSDAHYPLDVERLAARFASWYELFPRSETDHPSRHGTFDDVRKRLPAIRDMGFDVLYFPPIHPIGRTHRKGPNNTLTAGPDDPGSPYAIGSHEGGTRRFTPSSAAASRFVSWSPTPPTTAWRSRWTSPSNARRTTPGSPSTPAGSPGVPTARSATPRTRPRSTRTSSTSTSMPRTRCRHCGWRCATWCRAGSTKA
ncbi:maltotransferase domain-containing protein [Halomonas sp. E19]|uniref:maltotransferase domain-containing protein n=1 Tax=Halomonas sp. E19 TaxID=3397247 RepID=UPI004033BBDF